MGKAEARRRTRTWRWQVAGRRRGSTNVPALVVSNDELHHPLQALEEAGPVRRGREVHFEHVDSAAAPEVEAADRVGLVHLQCYAA